MSGELSPIDKAKFVAAKRAAEFVEDGMRVGLGTGSTAAWLVRCLGEMVREEGLRFRGVPTSTRTAELARDVGIEVISLDEAKWLDITIDGADEFDADLNLIKGGGGALLQEKIVATASDQMVVIADAGKEVETLGAFPLPVEVIPFGWQTSQALIEETLVAMDVLGRNATLRMNGDAPFVTDEGNYILDLHLNRIGNARQLALVLNQIPGVVENGLFMDICDIVVVGYGDGRVELRNINEGTVEHDRLDFVESDNLFTDLADSGRDCMTFDYDLFVIGGGSGGVRAARVAAGETGAKVALAEEDRYGGTCVIRGCVPKKLMVFASEYPAAMQDARAYGWDVTAGGLDWRAFRGKLHAELDRLEGIYRNILKNNGVETFDLRARVADPHTVELADGTRKTARHILIATGGRPVLPGLPGDELGITSNDIFHLEELPKTMLIVGGGYIACEFAGIMNGLGVQTTQYYRGAQFRRRSARPDLRRDVPERYRRSSGHHDPGDEGRPRRGSGQGHQRHRARVRTGDVRHRAGAQHHRSGAGGGRGEAWPSWRDRGRFLQPDQRAFDLRHWRCDRSGESHPGRDP